MSFTFNNKPLGYLISAVNCVLIYRVKFKQHMLEFVLFTNIEGKSSEAKNVCSFKGISQATDT